MADEARMRELLLKMAVWSSYGAVQNLNATHGNEGHPEGTPPGESEPDYEYWAERWENSAYKAAVLEEAEKAWSRILNAPPPVEGESSQEEVERILREGEGWPAEVVALRFNCTPTRIRRLRAVAGFLTASGTLGNGKPSQEITRSSEALRMAEAGMSERAIGMILGVPKTSVRRLLGRR